MGTRAGPECIPSVATSPEKKQHDENKGFLALPCNAGTRDRGLISCEIVPFGKTRGRERETGRAHNSLEAGRERAHNATLALGSRDPWTFPVFENRVHTPFFYCFCARTSFCCFTDTTVWERLQRLAVWRLGGFPFSWDLLFLGWCAAQGGGDAGIAGAWCFLGAGSRLGPVGSARWSTAVTVRLRSASSAEIQARRTGSPPATILDRKRRDDELGRKLHLQSIYTAWQPHTLVCARFINTRGKFNRQ